MTYEYAAYFKLLLLCGYKGDLEQYIDDALVEQNPLSDLVLELSTAGDNDKKVLSVLNKYLMRAKDSDIDYHKSVFDLVMSFLKRKYNDGTMSMQSLAGLMYQLAIYTERYLEEPWETMYFMGYLFDEAEAGYIDREDYQRKFDAFINDEVCFCDYPSTQSKESFFKKLTKRIRGIHT